MEKAINFKNRKSFKEVIDYYKKTIVVLLLILALFIAGEIMAGYFFSVSQFLLTIKMASFIALFGLCQMFVISVGSSGLDLSVGYMATMTAVFTAGVMDGQNENLYKAILIAILFGAIIGFINGTLISYIKLPPLIVTLAMSSVLQGVINVYTSERNITGKPSPMLHFITAKSSGIVPNILFLIIIVVIFTNVLFTKTRLGVAIFGVGSNDRNAYLSGINVQRIRMLAYMLSSIIASMIGLLLIGNMGTAFKDMGSNYVMPSIASAVVGGVSMSGGEGSYINVFLGAVFLQTLTNLLVAMGWGDAGKWLGFGIVLYILLIAYVSNRRKR